MDGRSASGIASYHSSLLAKTGSTSKIDAAEIEQPVANDLADGEAGEGDVDFLSHGAGTFERFKRGHASYLGKRNARC